MSFVCFIILFLGLFLFLQDHAEAQTQTPGEKIQLRLLYVGSAHSEREKDFVTFLSHYFQEVKSADILNFSEQQTAQYDVILFDYEGDGFKAKRPKLSHGYKRATVTIGVYGALMHDDLRTKCDYT